MRAEHEEETSKLRILLDLEREEAEQWMEVAEVEHLLRVDAEDRLEEAEDRIVRLTEDRDLYQRKHCGAEAALKGCKILGERHAAEMERGMQDMARNVSAMRFVHLAFAD